VIRLVISAITPGSRANLKSSEHIVSFLLADNPDIKSLCVRGMEIKPHDRPRRYAAGHDFEACPQKG
jgi:hypothetical protein